MHLQDLPNELIQMIFSCFGLKDIKRSLLLSKNLYQNIIITKQYKFIEEIATKTKKCAYKPILEKHCDDDVYCSKFGGLP